MFFKVFDALAGECDRNTLHSTVCLASIAHTFLCPPSPFTRAPQRAALCICIAYLGLAAHGCGGWAGPSCTNMAQGFTFRGGPSALVVKKKSKY